MVAAMMELLSKNLKRILVAEYQHMDVAQMVKLPNFLKEITVVKLLDVKNKNSDVVVTR